MQLNITAQTLLTNCIWTHFYSCFQRRHIPSMCYMALPTLRMAVMSLSAPDLCLESPCFLICQCHVWSPPLKHHQDENKDFRGKLHQQSLCWVFYCFFWVFLTSFFSIFGCWSPTEQGTFSLAVRARAARDAVTHLFPLLDTWIGGAFLHIFLWHFLMCTLRILSRGIKTIIKKAKKRKKSSIAAIKQKLREGMDFLQACIKVHDWQIRIKAQWETKALRNHEKFKFRSFSALVFW